MARLPLPGVRLTLAVVSGKGGVGKTTVTVNLALALRRLGAQVGVFDADVYGPNVPLMLGIHQRQDKQAWAPIVRASDAPAYIKPLERFGLKVMSVGLLVSENQVINPQASAVGQLVVQTLRDVLWGELDYLLIDLPPSAGQPQEGLLQQVRLSGVVVVTTPQDLSLLDASRSLQLFERAGVPVLGLVENMSSFICPNCGEEHEIFQHSDKWRPEALAETPVLGRIPLAAGISQGINQANPLMHEWPDGPQARIFLEMAAAIRERVG